jgi:hypothetical protein
MSNLHDKTKNRWVIYWSKKIKFESRFTCAPYKRGRREYIGGVAKFQPTLWLSRWCALSYLECFGREGER